MCRIHAVVQRALLASILLMACAPADEPEFSFYDERIDPIVTGGCLRNPSGAGCHIANANGTSLGNLDELT